MEEKDDKSKEKKEAPQIVSSPKLEKTVLHALTVPPTKKIIKSGKEDLDDDKAEETGAPEKEHQTQQSPKIQAVSKLDRVVEKDLNSDRETGQKQG